MLPRRGPRRALHPPCPRLPRPSVTMKHRGSNPVAWSLAVALSLSAPLALGQEQAATAEALFRQARDLAGKGNYAAACPKFAASQRLDPGYGTLYNLGECLALEGKTASAWA